jgi:peptidoglycan/xylan/chitin deacetylase (PgdA/CDA1 family)
MDTTPRSPRRGFEEYLANLNAGRREGEPARSFTLFVGTAGLQLDESRHDLDEQERVFAGVSPRHNPVFRYAETLDEIRATAENIRRLDHLGVEIGSHTVRHEAGGAFDRARWEHEFTDHARILRLAELPAPSGFRAPFLETNEALYETLEAHHFTYDASDPQNAIRWPRRHPGTSVWVFGVPRVPIPGRARPVLFYDLNLLQRLRRAAIEAGVQGEDAITTWMDEAYYQAARHAFQQRYRASRAPFLISGHGNFERPIGRLMREICGLPDVRCTTFREAAAFMQQHPELEGAE